jgi:hypothetical protein
VALAGAAIAAGPRALLLAGAALTLAAAGRNVAERRGAQAGLSISNSSRTTA